MSQQEPIALFAKVEILPNYTMECTKRYLKQYCTIDTLGDTLYIKRMGNDFTTYAIEYDSDEISKIRKIKDEKGNNLNEEPIFERDYLDDDNYDGNYDDSYDDDCNDDSYEPLNN